MSLPVARRAFTLLYALYAGIRLMFILELTKFRKYLNNYDITGLSPSATSQHLARMREEGLIDSQRDAQRIHYFIKNEAVNTIIATLKNLYCP
ncbi:hypothetical protein BXA16_05965 [Salmonella enterica subsp. enterica serovar Typhimurium]|nr:hypothetical protein BXA16_05965 [Salmonella enterica subsp. enterica serovar Typhimurium]